MEILIDFKIESEFPVKGKAKGFVGKGLEEENMGVEKHRSVSHLSFL